ncbi:DUF6894 family protein [Aurantiacibacter poecillastricola]|uniref:DUF6894 family protein n=1 Tax=Aurantiacibacter poecillastricola TaxID=3064385 RepID=UPI00273E38E3|nr:hypothetical protein [Aurantiacibacter sp. 219JJ12-13]MDP5263236.1 hypothetical protein [Aurantiacibacter sp. 219JJ12-13]
MALYFFHFESDEGVFPDDMGLDLATAEDAYLEAVRSAHGIWSEMLGNREDPRNCRFRIVDCNGVELYDVPFAELLESCRNAPRRPSPSQQDVQNKLMETHQRVLQSKTEMRTLVRDVRASLAESVSLLGRLDAFSEQSAPRRDHDAGMVPTERRRDAVR